MTSISIAAAAAREQARTAGGQFGEQERSAEEIALSPTTATEVTPIGSELTAIPAAQARRELPVGQVIQTTYLTRPGNGEADVRTVEKQAPHDMVSVRVGDERGVHMDWSHNKAYRDADGTIIVADETGLPFVAFTPLDSPDAAVPGRPIALSTSKAVFALYDQDLPASEIHEHVSAHAGMSAIQKMAIRHPNASAQTLQLIASQDGTAERTLEDIARHPNADTATFSVLSRSPHRDARLAAAFQDATAPDDIERLSRDEDALVRTVVARHGSLTPESAERLAGDSDRDVRRAVARNPKLSKATLERLAKGDGFVRGEVAQNPSASEQTLRELSADRSTGNQTEALVAANPSAPADLIEKATVSPDKWVREHAARNPNLTAAQAHKLAGDSRDVRAALAGHTSHQDVIATFFAGDDVEMHRRVISNRYTPRRLVERYLDNDSVAIQKRAQLRLAEMDAER